MEIHIVKNAERTGAQASPLAMSVCFKRENAFHYRELKRKSGAKTLILDCLMTNAFSRRKPTLMASGDACAPVSPNQLQHFSLNTSIVKIWKTGS